MTKRQEWVPSQVTETPSVLLVEDRIEDAELTRAAFEEAGLGWDLRWVGDGVQATTHVQGISSGLFPVPDLILLDLNLPRKDGRTLLAEFRTEPLLRDVPVIVITGSRSEADIEACHRAGAASFLFKPVNWDQYRAMVTFVEQFWKSHFEIPPVWINTLGSEVRSGNPAAATLLGATQHLEKAAAAAGESEEWGWKQVLLIALNLKRAWDALTCYGESEIRADTGFYREVETESPWIASRLSEIEKQLIELEGRVAELAYEMEGFSKSTHHEGRRWLRDKLDGLIGQLKGIVSKESQMVVDQSVELGVPG